MKRYRADLHIHSVLSPCGDLEMSPSSIIHQATVKGLDVIAVTDHNHTGHARLSRRLSSKSGIWVVYGCEVTTREEVHCLTFFDTDDQLEHFQAYIDKHMPVVENDVSLFGHQVIVDEDEMILEEITQSLYPGLDEGIEDVAGMVRSLGGIFVPAHVDRNRNGIYSQLGLFPEGLDPDAVEIFRSTPVESFRRDYPELLNYQLLKSSDAHFLEDIGRCYSILQMEKRNFGELRMALQGIADRAVVHC